MNTNDTGCDCLSAAASCQNNFIRLWVSIATFILTAALYAAPAQANEDENEEDDTAVESEENEVFDMDLSDILNITVTVSSKKAEKIQDTPGIVTVYSKDQIQSLGYYTLAELADITPSYSSFSSLGSARYETRGQSDGLNAKHLLLIDGIPVNHARDYMAFNQEQLPLQFVDQAEFLRGPASALYGVSAFFGVVNLRSQRLDEPGSASELMISAGDSNDEKRIMTNFLQHNEAGEANVAFSYFQKDPSFGAIPVSGPQRNFLRDDQISIFGKASYRFTNELAGLSAGVIYMSRENGFGESWNGGVDTSEVSKEVRDILIPYVKYETQIKDSLKFNSYVKYNRSGEFGTQSNEIWGSPFFFQYNVITTNVEYLAETQWDIAEDSSLITGVNLDIRGQDDGESFLFNPDAPNNGDAPFYDERAKTTSIHAQYSKTIDAFLKGLIFTAGARYDKGEIEENTYTQLSPRVALVQRLSDRLNLKLLWGNALKAPGVKEVGHNVEKSVALIDPANTPNIEPETIETIELAAVYTTNRASYTLTLFDTVTENQILETQLDTNLYVDPTGDIPGFFQNVAGETTSTGIELDVRAALSANSLLFANLSTADTEDPAGNELANVPKLKINIGGSYVYKDFKFGGVLRYVDEYSTNNGSSPYEGQMLADINVRYPIASNLDVELKIKNISDENYYQANNGAPGLLREERETLLSFRLKL